MHSHTITVIPSLTGPNVLHLLSSRAGTGAAIVAIGVVVLVLVLVGSHILLSWLSHACLVVLAWTRLAMGFAIGISLLSSFRCGRDYVVNIRTCPNDLKMHDYILYD